MKVRTITPNSIFGIDQSKIVVMNSPICVNERDRKPPPNYIWAKQVRKDRLVSKECFCLMKI